MTYEATEDRADRLAATLNGLGIAIDDDGDLYYKDGPFIEDGRDYHYLHYQESSGRWESRVVSAEEADDDDEPDTDGSEWRISD